MSYSSHKLTGRQGYKQNPKRTNPISSSSPFDFAELQKHLSSTPPSVSSEHRLTSPHLQAQWKNHAVQGGSQTNWADSFVAQPVQAPVRTHLGGHTPWREEFGGPPEGSGTIERPRSGMRASPGLAPWQRPVPVRVQPQVQYQPHPLLQHGYLPPGSSFTTFPAQHAPTPYQPLPGQILQPTQATPMAQTRYQTGQDARIARDGEPLTDSQEVLAQTAATFINQLKSEETILMQDPKFANSQFMKLVSAIGDRSVVAQEGEKVFADGEVGEGAKFVSRDIGAGWASDFNVQSQDGLSNPTREVEGESTSQVPIHRSFGHYTSLQRAPGVVSTQLPLRASDQIAQSDWDQQFMDQEAILQRSTRTQTPSTRPKSVHFDPSTEVKPLGNGIPNSLEEAMAHSTAIPGSNLSWENTAPEEAFDFDEEMFYGFNGPMTSVKEPRIGVADMEGWKAMDQDWTEYQQGMGMKSQQDRYLFQAKNPYTSDMLVDQASPTLKVSRGSCVLVL